MTKNYRVMLETGVVVRAKNSEELSKYVGKDVLYVPIKFNLDFKQFDLTKKQTYLNDILKQGARARR